MYINTMIDSCAEVGELLTTSSAAAVVAAAATLKYAITIAAAMKQW